VFHISELEPFIPTPKKFLKRRSHDDSIKDIEIFSFRSNYKKNNMNTGDDHSVKDSSISPLFKSFVSSSRISDLNLDKW